jgi:UDP-glucose 4-epimerase
MNILVVGGAGYVGSHFSFLASKAGHNVCIFDDFSSGHSWAIKSDRLIRGSLLDYRLLVDSLTDIDVVCHFAAKIVVSESIEKTDLYFENNVVGTSLLLDAMAEAGCDRLVFSSTAAVYGQPEIKTSIREDQSLRPINPYGESKLLAERNIRRWVHGSRRQATIFRYFNAAGAMPQYGLGEFHQPETHLIPNILNALLYPTEYSFSLFGNDYATKDGTCIRDYVHIKDIAFAHLIALDSDRLGCDVFNLGYGRGYSNLEVIKACERMCGEKLDYVVSGRRVGDPPLLTTDSAKALNELGWTARHSDLDEIVSDALIWHRDVLPEVLQNESKYCHYNL